MRYAIVDEKRLVNFANLVSVEVAESGDGFWEIVACDAQGSKYVFGKFDTEKRAKDYLRMLASALGAIGIPH